MKKTLLILSLLASMIAVIAGVPRVNAYSPYFTANCQGCHGTTTTCAGCHAHGVHSDYLKDDINLSGTPDQASYAPGDTVTVTIDGGYRGGWVRAILYDQDMNELTRSTGSVATGATAPCCGPEFPLTLSAPAPATPGTYTWKVAWYGNAFDLSQVGGTTFFGPNWTPDPGNPNHGQEIVDAAPFTVTAPAAPDINLNPASLDFGTVTAGSSASLASLVEDLGDADLDVTNIALCAGTSSEFSWSPDAPFTVTPGGNVSLTVTYAPTDAGTDTGCIEITSNDPSTPMVTLNVTGIGFMPPPPQPDINLNPPALNFGTVTAGNSSTLNTLVENLGTADLNVANIALCAGTSSEFSWSPDAPFTVTPSGNVSLAVTYAPTDAGTDTGCIEITSNDPSTPMVTLNVTGTGLVPPPPQPDINLNPPALDFGTVTVGGSSTLNTLVDNLGTADLNVTSIALCAGTSSEFSWSPDAPFTATPSGNVSLAVTYAPTDAGTDTGCIEITSNDPATPTVTLNITGTGFMPPPAEPDINLNPAALTFGTVTIGGSQTLSTQVQNLGGADLNVTNIALCAGTSSEFSWSPDAPFTVTPGGNAELSVTYTPIDEGADTGCIEITSNDPSTAVVSLSLSGTGMLPPPPQPVDLDIKQFRATKRVSLSKGKPRPVEFRLVVRNNGTAEGTAPATLVGVQGGTEVYNQTVTVTDTAGGGAARYEFPSYMPTAAGDILWTVTINDQDADIDTATAVTTVVP